jgi:5-methylthioadenosine/S-adenosylhomocysteine deaminase
MIWDLLLLDVLYPTSGDFRRWAVADIAIGDREIAAIEPGLPRVARNILGDGGLIAIPGLINMHTHAHDMFWRGSREGAGVDREFPTWFWDAYDHVTPEAALAAANAAYLDSLCSGVTFVADHLRYQFDGPPFVAAMAALGVRGAVFAARPYADASPLSIPHETSRHFPAALEAAARLPRRPIMMHAQETRRRLDEVMRRTKRSTVEILDDHGLLHEQTFLVHLCAHSRSDLELVAARGANVIVTPAAEMKLGEASIDPGYAAAAGIRWLIGTDGPAYQNANDLFGDIKLLALLWARSQGPAAVDVGELLAAATWRAAEALGLPPGRIAVDAPAHLTLLAADSLALQPLVRDPFVNVATQLVYSATRADVRHVVVGGHLVVRDGRCLTGEPAPILAAMRRAVADHFHLYPSSGS